MPSFLTLKPNFSTCLTLSILFGAGVGYYYGTKENNTYSNVFLGATLAGTTYTFCAWLFGKCSKTTPC